MDPDRKQQTNLNDEDDNFITEYKQVVIHNMVKNFKIISRHDNPTLAVATIISFFQKRCKCLGNQVVTTSK